MARRKRGIVCRHCGGRYQGWYFHRGRNRPFNFDGTTHDCFARRYGRRPRRAPRPDHAHAIEN